MNDMTPIKRIFLCLAVLLVSIFGLVAWKTTDIQGQRAFSAVSIACSADGKTVYTADIKDVWKSEDGGKSWVKITPP